MTVDVIGAGLAGVEAANTLAQFGYDVILHEMKPIKHSAAHKSNDFAELVCSNSLKNERLSTAAGLLKAEARLLGSLVIETALRCRVDAGGALAVNRENFSKIITDEIRKNKRVTVVPEEVKYIDTSRPIIIATGPLTDGDFAKSLAEIAGGFLSFYDAAAPIVTFDSLCKDRVFAQNRYEYDSVGDYLNAYFDKESFERFYSELVNAKTAKLHDADDFSVYEGCMPIEKLAKRGTETIRFGPMKPVGLKDPRTAARPYAAVQLRKEDKEGRLYNIVGFQTNLTFSEQQRVFRMIPGLEQVEFARYGVMHRNSFVDSPKVLRKTLNLKEHGNIYIAGQLNGMEGYIESAVGGILAAQFMYRMLQNKEPVVPSKYTMCGALLEYITTENKDFQPMGANMGILPAPENRIKDKKERYLSLSKRALAALEKYIDAAEIGGR